MLEHAPPVENGIVRPQTSNGLDQHNSDPHYDVIIVGAGFGGLRMLHEARQLGLRARVLEKATDVGGTWYYNRYPGARTDSEGYTYILNFSKEMNNEWIWKERYPTQEEVLKYLQAVADRFDMRRDIEFNIMVESAHFDEVGKNWTLSTSTGNCYTADFFVPCLGLLSVGLRPPYPGLDSFQGQWYQTADWPKKKIDFTGKRVAVIGTGATGIQITPIAALNAKSVTVFQRTPNYVIPARNTSITDEHMSAIKRNYNSIWDLCRSQVFGFAIPKAGRTMDNVKDPQQRQKILEAGWEAGGFRFVCDTFDDLVTNAEANNLASEFVRRKIRTIVHDPKTAELLCPQYPLLVKRPPLGHFYYETFNLPNVELVDISANAIEEITPRGLRTGGKEYEFDVMVFAIGFDAVTGPLNQIDIRGIDGRSLRDDWHDGVKTYLGLAAAGYPNMFLISGPQGPFGNAPPVIDAQATWIGQAIAHVRDLGTRSIEVKSEAERKWRKDVQAAYDATLLSGRSAAAHSWYVGANISGRPLDVLLYFGGLDRYIAQCDQEVADKFPSCSLA